MDVADVLSAIRETQVSNDSKPATFNRLSSEKVDVCTLQADREDYPSIYELVF